MACEWRRTLRNAFGDYTVKGSCQIKHSMRLLRFSMGGMTSTISIRRCCKSTSSLRCAPSDASTTYTGSSRRSLHILLAMNLGSWRWRSQNIGRQVVLVRRRSVFGNFGEHRLAPTQSLPKTMPAPSRRVITPLVMPIAPATCTSCPAGPAARFTLATLQGSR
jgi:hypothetical protein